MLTVQTSGLEQRVRNGKLRASDIGTQFHCQQFTNFQFIQRGIFNGSKSERWISQRLFLNYGRIKRPTQKANLS